MLKMKRSHKKDKALEERIRREEFLRELKNPSPPPKPVRASKKKSKLVPRYRRSGGYDAGPDGAMGNLIRILQGRK